MDDRTVIVRAASALLEPTSNNPAGSVRRAGVVLVDGSALYLAVRALYGGAQLDYSAFVRVLCDKADLEPGGADSTTRWVMWTAASPQNEGQSRFLDFAEKDLRWEVRRVSPMDSFIVEPDAIRDESQATKNRLMRFDASIAFAMGRLAEDHRIVVVSDSFAIAQPLALARKLSSAAPVLAFFGRALDSRWHGLLRRVQSGTIQHINFDEHADKLFAGMHTRVEEGGRHVVDKKSVF